MTHNQICLVVNGDGSSRIGDETIHWSKHDTFTIPHWSWATHTAESTVADFFIVTDKSVFENLDLVAKKFRTDFMPQNKNKSGIGASVIRKEDHRFLTGTGRFIDDIKFNSCPRMLHCALSTRPCTNKFDQYRYSSKSARNCSRF